MKHTSSTPKVPSTGLVPNHVTIIMDGNGRWATANAFTTRCRTLRGVDAVRGIVKRVSNAASSI